MATMRAWQYSSPGELESTLRLVTDLPKPSADSLRQEEVLIKTLYASLNPADRMVANLGTFTKLRLSLPVTPGYDFCDLVEAVNTSDTTLKPGDLVFGCLGHPVTHGTLSEYFIGPTTCCARVSSGVRAEEAAGLGSAAITAYQALAPFITSGQRVFINGGSGGVGLFAIQFAKILGAEVTVTCSTRNIELCQELGADIIDYTHCNVLDVLKQRGQEFDHVIDNVGNIPELYSLAHLYTNPNARFIQVGGQMSSMQLFAVARNTLLPGFLGGGKRAYHLSMPKVDREELSALADFVAQGRARIVIDQHFKFEDTIQAFEKLKTGRARGKIIISIY
ncbi:unnamed protein product [Clonostachys rosea]|uniref:Enoyl reductase (ER) domain-containing protein n=1 Tax=Bionectria ochroleuca TaxID=29856 RepID=A0ABY6TSU0_BIOOC|nr:unnamed protein product [Clonostachys rosea]